MKRAGLDYWEHVDLHRHRDWPAFLKAEKPERLFLFSTAGSRSIYDVKFQSGDALVFGSETAGLSDALLAQYPEAVVGVPMQTQHVRSLNLANTVSIAVYEALRQMQP